MQYTAFKFTSRRVQATNSTWLSLIYYQFLFGKVITKQPLSVCPRFLLCDEKSNQWRCGVNRSETDTKAKQPWCANKPQRQRGLPIASSRRAHERRVLTSHSDSTFTCSSPIPCLRAMVSPVPLAWRNTVSKKLMKNEIAFALRCSVSHMCMAILM